MTAVGVTELGYVGFGITDVPAWRAFASDILGAENYDEAGKVKLRIDDWHNRIILHPGEGDDLLYAGFRVAGPSEFQQMQSQLADHGISFEVATAEEAAGRCVLEYLRLEDPAGTPLEIFHGPRIDRHKPFRPGRGMHGKFKTGAGGVGHMIVPQAEEEGATSRFYSEVLGMRGSVEMMPNIPGVGVIQATFMHCNEREHTIAFGAPKGQKRLDHLMLEVDNIDDVGLAYDLVRQAGHYVRMDLGRHSNDRTISFYVQTPSGWFLEYGSGGDPAIYQSEYGTAEIWGHGHANGG